MVFPDFKKIKGKERKRKKIRTEEEIGGKETGREFEENMDYSRSGE